MCYLSGYGDYFVPEIILSLQDAFQTVNFHLLLGQHERFVPVSNFQAQVSSAN